jgi:hypothetical protein
LFQPQPDEASTVRPDTDGPHLLLYQAAADAPPEAIAFLVSLLRQQGISGL